MLFMHAYGYIQANSDFGNIRRYLEHGEMRRQNYLSGLSSEEYFRDALNLNINITEPASLQDYKGLNNLIYRKFCVIRIRKFQVETV